ncbi:MAG TPA: ATP-binding protein [Stenomitos sp.]
MSPRVQGDALHAFKGFDPQGAEAISEFAERAMRFLGARWGSYWTATGTQLHLDATWEVSAAEAIAAFTGMGHLSEGAKVYPDAGGGLLYLPVRRSHRQLGAFLFLVPLESLEEAAELLQPMVSALALAIGYQRLEVREAVVSERLERITNAMQIPLVFVDSRGRPLQLNRAYRELHGLDDAELPESMEALWHRVKACYQSPAEVSEELSAWYRSPNQGASLEIELKNPREAYFRLLIVPLTDSVGEFAGAVFSFYDVTQERRLLRLQADFIDSLEERVNARTRELIQTNQELTRANQIQSLFISNMSHELRTPLQSIVGSASMLEEKVFGPLTHEQVERVQDILRASDKLKNLVSTVLDLSKLDSGHFKMFYEWVDPREQIHEAARELRLNPYAADKHLVVDLPDELPMIWASPETTYSQVLMNLAINALKFTEPGGEVRLAARVEGETMVYEVRDTGVGIPAEALPRIFDRFYQVDSSSTRRYDGSGLGLAIAKEIVELHGGSIQVDSRLGAGSCFSVRLPLMGPKGKEDPCIN